MRCVDAESTDAICPCASGCWWWALGSRCLREEKTSASLVGGLVVFVHKHLCLDEHHIREDSKVPRWWYITIQIEFGCPGNVYLNFNFSFCSPQVRYANPHTHKLMKSAFCNHQMNSTMHRICTSVWFHDVVLLHNAFVPLCHRFLGVLGSGSYQHHEDVINLLTGFSEDQCGAVNGRDEGIMRRFHPWSMLLVVYLTNSSNEWCAQSHTAQRETFNWRR